MKTEIGEGRLGEKKNNAPSNVPSWELINKKIVTTEKQSFSICSRRSTMF